MQYVIGRTFHAFQVRQIIQNYQTQDTTFNTLLIEVSNVVTGPAEIGVFKSARPNSHLVRFFSEGSPKPSVSILSL